MPTAVWTWAPDYPIQHRLAYPDEVVIEMRAGKKKIVNKGVAHSRADGTGSVTSYHGQNIFTLTFDRKNYAGDNQFIDMLDFIVARKNGDPSFYFYNPTELVTPDATGVNTTGRYLVRIYGDVQYELRKLKLYGFGSLTFEEVFE